MKHEPEEFLYVIDLQSYNDLDVETGLNEHSWEDFKEALLTHRVSNKKDGKGFMPVMMKQESEWVPLYTKKDVEKKFPHYRGDINVEAITALVIDCDQPGTIEKAEEVFDGYEYVVYSTHNFTPETPWKFRMVLRLHQPIPVDNWTMCFEAIKSRIDIDPSCCNPSRLYYYPSHSINSNISPRAYHKPGQAISMEQVLALAADPELIEKRKLTKYRRVDHSQRIARRRHFSGEQLGRYDMVENTDISLERYTRDHQVSIDNYLIEDSRHNLALTITGREIERFGPKVDYKSLLAFIFKVADEHGSRAMETGDTPDELPGMIITAMLKYAPEAYEEAMNEHDGKLEQWLESMVSWASINYKSVRFNPAHEVKKKPQNKEMRDYYVVIRERQKRNLESFMKNHDFEMLTERVLKHELKVEKPRYTDIAQALVNFQYGLLTRVLKKTPEQAWSLIKERIPSLKEVYSSDRIPVDEKKLKYALSAYLVECSRRMPKEKKAERNSSPSP